MKNKKNWPKIWGFLWQRPRQWPNWPKPRAGSGRILYTPTSTYLLLNILFKLLSTIVRHKAKKKQKTKTTMVRQSISSF